MGWSSFWKPLDCGFMEPMFPSCHNYCYMGNTWSQQHNLLFCKGFVEGTCNFVY
ncbi:hypothetical protein GW17_00001170 [Ensete ventricosum]|nr:hypothetical protein GW17_00001170 [Ensete ventricosum]